MTHLTYRHWQWLTVSIALLIGACAGAQQPTQKVYDCAAGYHGCAAGSDTTEAYVACRARVDAVCLDGGQ